VVKIRSQQCLTYVILIPVTYLGVDHALVSSYEAEEADGDHGRETVEEHLG
jgi:hypothetical protein